MEWLGRQATCRRWSCPGRKGELSTTVSGLFSGLIPITRRKRAVPTSNPSVDGDSSRLRVGNILVQNCR